MTAARALVAILTTTLFCCSTSGNGSSTPTPIDDGGTPEGGSPDAADGAALPVESGSDSGADAGGITCGSGEYYD